MSCLLDDVVGVVQRSLERKGFERKEGMRVSTSVRAIEVFLNGALYAKIHLHSSRNFVGLVCTVTGGEFKAQFSKCNTESPKKTVANLVKFLQHAQVYQIMKM